ncbi:transcriptional regulator (AhrC(ArgR)-arginine) [Candidatus Hydrogenisulfobacillus filiaventi]|uniref:Arginine repressor n=1 Tax=Candidatus Hydrogenisulfobacillus filiaventi TaxID=2707344 RepID=A0A6F8ZFY1_9FIRM|nr:arginine repressor [Bacillota bacterium]CAB1128658.1 transcriptional regulator (AhrC(ArgR)-arginine) [Candidatus Hydrogenisulfobacillus filiaventi]
MTDKRTRQALIRDLIRRQPIETQDQLSELLAAMGIPVTQATVSRDIKELGLVKVPHGNSHYYALPEEAGLMQARDRLRRLLGEVLVSVTPAENLVVIKTVTAGAEVVSEAVDGLGWPEIVGTLAGENTVLVVVRSREEAPEVARRLEGLA